VKESAIEFSLSTTTTVAELKALIEQSAYARMMCCMQCHIVLHVRPPAHFPNFHPIGFLYLPISISKPWQAL